jgi:hypothetical protein
MYDGVTSFRGNKVSQVNYILCNETSLCFEAGRKLYICKIWSKKIVYVIGKLIDFGAENVHLGTRLGYPVSVICASATKTVLRPIKINNLFYMTQPWKILASRAFYILYIFFA